MKILSSVSPEDQIMIVKDVAAYLRVHPATVYRLLRQGKLPAFRVGADWRFRQDQIAAWARGKTGRLAEEMEAGGDSAHGAAPS
jgi:excisionase family DNA binding protein